MEHLIKDESGDRKYFTQIPNMIVNHSTAYEQSLYLIMKRLAGEGGRCYASLNFLAKKMGVDKKTVSTTITKLLKRKWIEETEKTKVRGGSVRTFVIIDLWRLNLDNYESGSQITTKKSGSVVPESGRQIPESGRQTDTSNIYNNIYTKKYSSFKKKSSFKKPFFRGMEMRKKQGKWYCLPADGSDWLEFAGQEKDITYS